MHVLQWERQEIYRVIKSFFDVYISIILKDITIIEFLTTDRVVIHIKTGTRISRENIMETSPNFKHN